MTRPMPAASAAASTVRVPSTPVVMMSCSLYRGRAMAPCTTRSQPAQARSMVARSRMSPTRCSMRSRQSA